MFGERDGRKTELHRAGAGPFHAAPRGVPRKFGVHVTVRGLNHLAHGSDHGAGAAERVGLQC
ncbi:hypothetical protein Acsp02_28510 [Actinoplanes sp. NBRC 103695]|nr:hypothetical protein Acsp02_28510 [Actinoplanes sp. NBRC 103695]